MKELFMKKLEELDKKIPLKEGVIDRDKVEFESYYGEYHKETIEKAFDEAFSKSFVELSPSEIELIKNDVSLWVDIHKESMGIEDESGYHKEQLEKREQLLKKIDALDADATGGSVAKFEGLE